MNPILGRLGRVKSLDRILGDVDRPEYRLRRALGPVQLMMLGVGAIIGAGIFATIGTAAAGDFQRPGAGPGLMVSFLITAAVCAFTALCYAEFASLVPASGSAYTYSYATLGELVAWIIGWDLIIEYAVGNVAVAISWANYFKTLLEGFGSHIPAWLCIDYQTALRVVDDEGVRTILRDAPSVLGVPVIFNLPAVLIVAAITVVLVWGIRESARFNAGMVIIKLLVLGFFVAVGAYWVRPENWTPFAPNGWGGISAGAAIVFFAYIGFDAVSTVAEETRDPARHMPVGIIGSLVLCTVVYVVVSAVFTGLISYDELRATLANEQAEPLTLALAHADASLGWAVGIVAFGSIVAHTAVLLVFQLGQPRIFFSMSRDGLLPRAFSRVHPRFRTPHVSTILTGLFVGGFAGVASLDEMVDLTNIGTLFAFMLVCAGIIVLRVKDPDRPRPFRVPGGWPWASALYVPFAAGTVLLAPGGTSTVLILALGAVVFAAARNHIFPVLGIVSCLYLVYYLPPTSWLRFAAWLNFGFVIYAVYGAVRSRLTGRERSARPAAHDAQTARLGAALAIGGTALLVVTSAADIVLGAVRDGATLDRAVSAILDPAAWTAPSAFLVIPLALHAAVLAPAVVLRARRAAREDASVEGTTNTIAVAAGLAIVIAAYLVAAFLA